MTELEWLACIDPYQMWLSLDQPTERKLTLFCAASEWGGNIDPVARDARYDVAEYVFNRQQPFTAFVRLFWEDYETNPRFRPTLRNLVDLVIGGRLSHHPWNGPDAEHFREILGNPFRPVEFDPNWRTSDVVAMCRGMYETRDFTAMPILADALQDAGCENADVLDHCRGEGPHVRGCWVVDLVLEKS